MLVTPKVVVTERVGRAAVWVFVALMGAAVVASLGFPGSLEPAGAPSAAPGVVEAGLSHGVTMFVGMVESAWRETVREVTRVVIAVLNWSWYVLYS